MAGQHQTPQTQSATTMDILAVMLKVVELQTRVECLKFEWEKSADTSNLHKWTIIRHDKHRKTIPPLGARLVAT